MVRESLNHQVKHLVSMQYSTVELRHLALEDVLAGPGRSCTATCRPSSAEVNALRKQFTDAQLQADPRRLPAGAPQEAAAARARTPPRSRAGSRSWSRPALAPIRQLRPVRELAAGVSRRRSSRRWTPSGTAWRSYDSAVVSMPDGTSAALYQRDPEQFRDLLRRTVEIHQRLLPRVAAAGRAVPRGAARTSPRPSQWAKTFDELVASRRRQ